jgi:hypothetical protein
VRYVPARPELVATLAAPDHYSRRHGADDAGRRPDPGRETPAEVGKRPVCFRRAHWVLPSRTMRAEYGLLGAQVAENEALSTKINNPLSHFPSES